MAEILNALGIYGIGQREENIMLQSMITGDPLLLIGKHGCAKTAAAHAIANSLGLAFQAYDASKSMFEDMLGLPDPVAMQQGKMQYITGPMTLWDKAFLFVDEVNRAAAEMQSKWLEIIRSRQVMGFQLPVIFIWGAMNPLGYEGTQTMDEAYIGRFSSFVYLPAALDMNDDDRTKIVDCVGLDDAPAVGFWTGEKPEKRLSVSEEATLKTGQELKRMLKLAQEQYRVLSSERSMSAVTTFLSKFAKAIFSRTKSSQTEHDIGAVELDGRRLGMMRRAIMAARAIEIARANIFNTELPGIKETIRYMLQATIPTGVNSDGGVNEEAEAHIDNVYQQLQDYLDNDKDMKLTELNYELLVSNDIMRKTEILLNEDVQEIAKNSAWTRILESSSLDISVLALLAMNIEIANRGTVPPNVLDQMVPEITDDMVTPDIPMLKGENVRYYSALKNLVNRGTNMIERLIICNHISRTIMKTHALNSEVVSELKERCVKDLAVIRRICQRPQDDKEVSNASGMPEERAPAKVPETV